jgi:serine/threonine-protein kinase
METIETLGKYEIKRALGRGAMGTVYEGWDPIIARRVAIKTVPLPDASDTEADEALARFRREAQAAGRLNHPNIVGVFDYGETNDLAYIVMEFVDGSPLKSVLDRQERFVLPAMIRIMEDLLAGLQFSHERGVVHRDIKPANIMLTSAGQAKIADFGIARIESSSMTLDGTVLGTPAYMSPEQFMGQVVDARTDVYSSGVLLYQLLTGERPFEGASMSAIMHKALNFEPPEPSRLSVTAPPSFDAVVRRAMAKRPEDRYPSALAFTEAIRAAMSGRAQSVREGDATLLAAPMQPRSAGAPPVIPPPRRSPTPIIVMVSAAVLLAVTGGGGWWFLLRTPAGPAGQPAAIEPSVTSLPIEQGVVPASPPDRSGEGPQLDLAAPPLPSSENPQHAPADLGAMRRQIAQYIAGHGCTLLGGDILDGGSAALTGFAGLSGIDDLRQGIAGIVSPNAIDWRAGGVDPVFCPALDALRPTVPVFGAGGSWLDLRMADGRTRLHDGEKVRLRLTMPDFAAWLRVDYIAHDKTVLHLYPQLANPKNGIKADVPRTHEAGEPVDLGHPSWEIGTPYGTDMIIAVASSEPLFSHPRPRNDETADAYLRDLQAAIDHARQQGVSLAGSALTLQALPK